MLATSGAKTILYTLTPDAFIIDISLLADILPKAIKVEIRTAIGTTRTTIHAIANALKSRIETLIVENAAASEFYAKDTICGQVSGREKKIREFARANDVILFAAGKKSSNGKVLYDIIKQENPDTYFIEDSGDIDYACSLLLLRNAPEPDSAENISSRVTS